MSWLRPNYREIMNSTNATIVCTRHGPEICDLWDTFLNQKTYAREEILSSFAKFPHNFAKSPHRAACA